MTQMLKYSFIVVLILVIGVLTMFIYNSHETNIRETQNINTVLETSNIGVLRSGMNTATAKVSVVQSDALVNELIADVSQRYTGLNVNIQYVFLDKNGNLLSEAQARAVNSGVVGIQYQVGVKDDSGKLKSTSTQRLVLAGYNK